MARKKYYAEEAVEETEAVEAAEETVTEEVTEVKEEAPKEEEAFFVYLGPSILGYIQNGSIYGGNREKVYAELARPLERFPRIKALLISDKTLVEDRVNVKKPGTRLYNEYRRLVRELKK